MIRVIDSMCGTGKSTKMFEIMRSSSDRKWLYITPFLSEIDIRIPSEMPSLGFKSPKNRGVGKMSDLEVLVSKGENIASTHVLFSNLTPEIVDMLIEKDYNLVIDEAISCVGLFDKEFKQADTEALLKSGMVTQNMSKRGQLEWNETDYPNHDGKYGHVRAMCMLGMLYCYNDTFLMFEYPPKLLENLGDVYVLTYLFNGSDMRCWLDLNQINYEILDNESLGLLSEDEVKEKVKSCLSFYNSTKINAFQQRKDSTFSKGWYQKARRPDYEFVKQAMRSCVVATGAKKGDVFWTTYKDYFEKVAGAGFKLGVSKDMPAFLPMNIRATNDYRNYSVCMYACNVFKNPVEVNYLKSQGVSVDEDTFALSEMIQFIWRGAVRQYKPMSVFILSSRMRKLLEDWLHG